MNPNQYESYLFRGLRNQHVVVVVGGGGGSGIGKSIAEFSLRLGVKVTISSRSEDKLTAVAEGGSITFFRCP
ncbi:hypothetical protein N9H39_11975 [Gammaproteobacteria bacterium]|nr:hypothetical protein [Gammaproteobacteria bacterium]